ncbi:hypothetical protein PVK06_041875 [Gossypium arboreum]|uniref:Uncharacterized protein n=1 Tax=Gossypium arboreum TaxID=29729 RepID=A0ABR0N9F2_GOSAR|nr:hypothetical protein PVK06_041875 [Gossypium arboreum]
MISLLTLQRIVVPFFGDHLRRFGHFCANVLHGIPVPNCLVGLNSMISQWPSSGSLLVKSAYNFLSKDALNPSEDSWKLVWAFVGPQHGKRYLGAGHSSEINVSFLLLLAKGLAKG